MIDSPAEDPDGEFMKFELKL